MKIFVLLPRIPYPLEKGDKLRAFNQIKQLSKNNEIVLCALNDDRKVDKQMAINALKPFCSDINFIDLPPLKNVFNIILAFFKGLPLQCGYFYSKRVKKIIEKIIEKHRPEILFGQLLRVAEYIRCQPLPKVIDYQDVFSMGMKRRADAGTVFLRPIFLMEYKRLKRYENFIFDQFDVKTIITEADRNLIPHPQRNEILVIPNGVDYDFFRPCATEKKYDLVFTGNMGYAPNINAVEYLANDILPKVWEKLPNVKMYIAGASPDPRVKRVASNNIIVSGWLDDIRDAYAYSKVFVAPIRIGTGLQNKLLEAMAMHLPCITTPLANNALMAENSKEIIVCSNAQAMADAIVLLLTNQQCAETMAQAGFDFVHRVYDWKNATNIMENAMKKVVSSKYDKI